MKKQQQEEKKSGPYEDSSFFYPEEGLKGEEAKRAAERDEFDLSKKEIKRKQKGE